MNTTKINKLKTLLIAHRGLSGIEAENTCASFIASGNRSYYGIETDIHRTRDGHFIVSHDNNLSRVAGVDISVENATLSELQEIILFDKDGTKGRVDLRPCVLENYISICKRYEKKSVLELKSDFTNEEIARIVEIIRGFDYLENVTFISFNYDNLLRVRELLPNQSAQFLFWELDSEIIERLVHDKIDVDIKYTALNEEIIKMLHEKGLTVNCWTVDNSDDAERLCSWGIDFITTNILE